MRLAGTLTIALAALLRFAEAGWCQDETSAAPPTEIRPLAGAPSLAAPEEVEGAWIGDDASLRQAPAQQAAIPTNGAPMATGPYAPPVYYDEYAEKAAAMYGGYPEEYSGIDLSGDPHGQYPGAGEGEYDSGGEEYCEGGGGAHCGGAAFGSLWAEVHSHRRFWLREEYLYWEGKGNPLPPLATTTDDGPPFDQETAGVLGERGTEILIGGERVNKEYRNGGRITAGMWLVDGEFLGIEGHYFGFEQSVDGFFEDEPAVLARPYTEVVDDGVDVTFTPAASYLTFPDFEKADGDIVDLNGQIEVTSKVATHSAGALLRKLMWIEFTQNWRVDGLAGYRFFRLDDGVMINDFWTETGGQLGTVSFSSYDYFQARNEFHGGELGLAASIHRGRWSLEAIGKVALGNVHQTVKIDGTSFVLVPGLPRDRTDAFRLLTQDTNDGVYKRDKFAALPETTLNLRFDLTCNIRLLAGYNFVYISQAQRSGKAIDLDVNLSQTTGPLVGPALPTFKFSNDDGYWLHGMSLGIEARW